MKIYKYPLGITDRQHIKMPTGAAIMCVQTQKGVPCLWAMVNPGAGYSKRTILTVGTGHEMAEKEFYRYLGTYQIGDGNLVFHVFDGGEA